MQDTEVGQVVNLINPRIDLEDNLVLLAPFSDEEFNVAAFHMHPDKAPGPDGLNLDFYRHFWSTCGEDVIASCRSWLNKGKIPYTMNETRIALVPKCDPQSMKDLRPISLCNVPYKILAKALAIRLEKVISKYVSKEQSVFLAGRSITDNALLLWKLCTI